MKYPLLGSHRAGEEQFEVTPSRGVGADDSLHVLQIADLAARAAACRRLYAQRDAALRWDLTGKKFFL